MCDLDSVVFKHHNGYAGQPMVHSYNVDQNGRPLAVVGVENERDLGYEDRYICECGMEYLQWVYMEEHLRLMAPGEAFGLGYQPG